MVFINFNDDGNVDNGAEEEISVNIERVVDKLLEVKENISNNLDRKINSLNSMINILT